MDTISMNEQQLASSDNTRPSFLITIDTEGDDLWSKPRTITTRNADFLHRFQMLCESYGFKPSYLVNYEMAKSDVFKTFGRDILKRKTAEIGMHLHAWNTPPFVPLTKDDFTFQPYLIEYSTEIIREKVNVMTDLLEDTFSEKMISHRAGRWSFNEIYAEVLVEKGYRIDCSVTPYISWKHTLGDPEQSGGTDYCYFPDDAYFLDLKDISQPGDSPLLEIPMTIVPRRAIFRRVSTNLSALVRSLNQISQPIWLRPRLGNRKDLIRIVTRAIRKKKSYLEFMLHSSELMGGGSPNFPNNQAIEKLYNDLRILFGLVVEKFQGATLKEYYQKFRAITGKCRQLD